MKIKMKVLFISPFENMRDAILRIGSIYPEIDLTVAIGNEAGGKQIAEERYSQNFDCIISRGNTATMIRQSVSVPVIDVKVTLHDVLESLGDVVQVPARIAAVGYSSIVSGMGYLNRFLPFDMKVYGFEHLDQLEDVFRQLQEESIRVIVCDTITYQIASQRGFDAHILRSGEDSIRYAFEHAVQLYQSNQSMLEENQLLRRLASANSESGTVVYSADRRLYYSSLTEQNPFVLEHLRERLSDFDTHDRFRTVKQHSGYMYRISARKIVINGKIFYAYFLSRKIPNLQNQHKSIRYYDEADIRSMTERSVFRIANINSYYSTELSRALMQRNPVFIYGEVGIGKNYLAEMIYLNSQYVKNPFVVVDLSLISKQTWDYLINKSESPLLDNGNTLFIKNIDAIDEGQLRQLLASIMEGEVSKRNRLIISCSAQRDLSVVSGLPVLKIVNQLNCLTISMASLHGQYGKIESSINLILQNFRNRNNRALGDVTPGAMSLLLHYSWPRNYDQLIRVVNKVATLAGDGPITQEIVEDALTTEMNFIRGETSQTGNKLLDLSKPLDAINSDIIQIVLEQNHGNQSLAAKSLGISRTTLWRIIKRKEEEE